MSTQSGVQGGAGISDSDRSRLFIASCIALIATAMTFAIRGDTLEALGLEFSLNKEQLGMAAGAWAYGFTISIFIGGQLVDALGMGRILMLAFLTHVAGILLTIFAGGFWMLFIATLCVGLGNGLIEAAINPLVATVYADRKTEKLNRLHVWFPGGIVIGGLVAYVMTNLHLGWKIKMAILLVPVAVYGLMFMGKTFPPTERVQQGVSTAGMYREALRPLFLVILFCMILTASTELAPQQWIPNIVTTTAGISGSLVLVWITGLMAVGRMVAGPIVHKLSPIGLLIGSAVMSAIGLLSLGMAESRLTVFAAATAFAIGVCYFWPTMLGVTSERFPKGGALLMAIVGGTGTLSVAIFTWIMGGFLDKFTEAAIPAGATVDQLKNATAGGELARQWSVAQAQGGRMSFRYMAILPVILIVIFSSIWLYDRARGGYKAVDLAAGERTS